MKRALIFVLLLTIALVVFVWQLPASLATGFLPPQASRFLQLHRITGTLWRGNALFTLNPVPSTLSLTWQCSPSIMPLGANCMISDSLAGSAALNLLAGSLSGQKLSASLPVQVMLGGALVAASPLVTADVAAFTWSATTLAVRGSVRAETAQYAFAQVPLALGEVTAECKPDPSASTDSGGSTDTASSCSISNRGGNARLDGQFRLSPRAFSGTLELATPGAAPQRVAF